MISGHENLSIRSLVWCLNENEQQNSFYKYRLFGGGLQGQLFEVNLHDLSVENRSDSYGGPIWMIDKNPQNNTIACACEDGSLRLFDLSGEQAVYIRAIQMYTLFVNIYSLGVRPVSSAVHGPETVRRLPAVTATTTSTFTT